MAATAERSVVVVEVGDHRLGLPAGVVEHVVAVPWITPLPGAPPLVEGVVDLHGELVAVVDGRRRMGAPRRPVRLSDRLVIVRTGRHRLALHVDAVRHLLDVASIERSLEGPASVLAAAGIARLDDGLLVVHDPDAFLSLEDTEALEGALADLPVTWP